MAVVDDKHKSQPNVDEMIPDEVSNRQIDHEQTGSAQDRTNSMHSHPLEYLGMYQFRFSRQAALLTRCAQSVEDGEEARVRGQFQRFMF